MHTAGGGHETVMPNRDKSDTRLGFDKNEPPTKVPKLGYDLSRLGLANFDPKLRSLTSWRFLSFVRLRGNRARSSKPSFRTAKPKPILLGFGVSILGCGVAKLGFAILQLVRRSPAEPFAGLRRFRTFSAKPDQIVLNVARVGARFLKDQKGSTPNPYIYDK